jgi:hypothetical protein
MDYDERCRRAATAQGLDPITEALASAGVEFAVEQTGGFCMAITVRHDGGTWAVTNDEGTIIAGWYPGDEWTEGPEEEPEYREPQYVEDLVELVRSAG